MTVEPTLDRQRLARAVSQGYLLPVDGLEFLATGSDVRSFSYRLTSGRQSFYLKVRGPLPDELVPPETAAFVMSRVQDAIAPLPVVNGGQPWLEFETFHLTLFPFVAGHDGWSATLSTDQAFRIGRSIRSLHELALPEDLPALPREAFADLWRARARRVLGQPLDRVGDAVSRQLLRLLEDKTPILSALIDQVEELAGSLGQEHHPLVCCHGDLHSGNVLLSESGLAHPVDWDTLSLAPREKDLMFLGAGIGGALDNPDAIRAFFQGYGEGKIHGPALRYFRLERIVQDVVAYCDQLLLSPGGGADREVSYQQLARQFEVGGVVEIALKT